MKFGHLTEDKETSAAPSGTGQRVPPRPCLPVCLCGWSRSTGAVFPKKLPFQWEEHLQRKECGSDSSSSSTYFIHFQVRTQPILLQPFTAFLLTPFVTTPPSAPHTHTLHLQSRRTCTWHNQHSCQRTEVTQSSLC